MMDDEEPIEEFEDEGDEMLSSVAKGEKGEVRALAPARRFSAGLRLVPSCARQWPPKWTQPIVIVGTLYYTSLFIP